MTAIISIIITTSIMEMSVVQLSVFMGDLTSPLDVVIFSTLVAIYTTGQYVILLFIKRKINLHKIPKAKLTHKIVSIFQYFSISLFIIIILQMIFASYYDIFLLILLIYTSYGLSVALLGFLAYRFFSWFRSNHDILIALYAIAMILLSINAVFMILTVMIGLTDKPEEIRPINGRVINDVDNIFNSINVGSSVLSFIFLWVATVLLLRYYSTKFGKTRYWIMVSTPLLYFLSQFQSIFFDLFVSFRLSDPFLFGIIFTMVFIMTKPVGGILFGLAFWIMSRRISQHGVKDYLMISAYGIIILFTSNQATNLIGVPYPPFGLVTVSYIGLSSYMLLIGIYSSAMTISQNSELRKYISTITVKEFKLLDSIGLAQVEQDLILKVVPLVRNHAQNMEQESGISVSLTDADIKNYMDDVLSEVRKFKND